MSKEFEPRSSRYKCRPLPEIVEPRHSLMEQLDRLAKKQLMYIHAPAGYGKTVSILLWLKDNIYKTAWIDLFEYGNTPTAFFKLFCEALLSLQGDNEPLRDIVTGLFFEMEPVINTVNAIQSLIHDSTTYALIIDDLHVVNDEEILKALPQLLVMLPHNYTVIMLSRTPPPDSFASLALKEGMGMMEGSCLKFSIREIKSFFHRRGHDLTHKEAEATMRRTDGWAIALNAIVLSGKYVLDENIYNAHGSYLEAFIKTQIWDKWPNRLQSFTMKASILDKMSPAMCDKIIGVNDSMEILEELSGTNTFVSRIEDGKYRFHDLFRSFLSKMLAKSPASDQKKLFHKAAECLLADDHFFEAVSFFMRCKDYAGAQDAMYAAANYNDKLPSIVSHVELYKRFIKGMIPCDAVEKYPFLLGYSAWGTFLDGDVKNMFGYMDKVREVFPMWVLRYPQYVETAAMLICLDPRTDMMSTVKNIFVKALSIAAAPEIKTASIVQNLPFFHRSHRDYSEYATDMDGKVKALKKVVEGMFGEGFLAMEECIRAGLMLEKDMLDSALEHAVMANTKLTGDCSSEMKFCAMMIMADILHERREQRAAEKIRRNIEKMIEADNALFLTPNYRAYVYRLEILSGDKEAAREWLEKYAADFSSHLTFYQIYQHFTTAIAYLAVGEYSVAILFLSKLKKLCEDYRRPRDIMETGVLLSIAYWNGGARQKALDALEKVLERAFDYGFIRVFINRGIDISVMLNKLCNQKQQSRTADKERIHFYKVLNTRVYEESKKSAAALKAATVKDVKLSKQQTAVVMLLADGLSYAEIAERLNLALSTVKTHIKNLYEKLDVTNCKDAVIRLWEMGIINTDMKKE